MTARTVWLASYPKSGNTWVRALLTALLLEEGELDINRLGHGPIASARWQLEHYTGLISSDLTASETAALRPLADTAMNAQLIDSHYRKIHDSLFSGADGGPIVPVEATLGAVYIVRDPRDVAVSFAHHADRDVQWVVERMCDAGMTFEHSLKRIGGQVHQHLGGWSHHVRSWTEHELFPVTVVRYEDLHADPAAQLKRVAAVGELEATQQKIAASVEATRFERLRAQEQQDGFRERAGVERRFFRRGEAGSWQEELPSELAGQLVEHHGRTMRRLGYH